MSVHEKVAWIIVGITALALTIHGVIIAVNGHYKDTTEEIYVPAFLAIPVVVGIKYGRRGRFEFDERDKEITYRALRISLHTFFVLVVFGLVGANHWLGPQMVVSLDELARLLCPAVFFIMLVRNVITLVLYRTN